jgi:hypothetical protein
MKNIYKKVKITLIFSLFISGLLIAQRHSLIENTLPVLNKNSKDNLQFIEPEDGHIITYTKNKDGKSQIHDIDLTEKLDIIVEFKEEPFFIQKKRQGFYSKSFSFFQSRFDQFNNDLIQIDQKVSAFSKNQTSPTEIKRQFHKVFFGAHLTIARASLSAIQNLSYVKKIHQNKKVKAYLNESVPLIRADSVRSLYDTEGDSIMVGIIDTGIDYNHPALGGGFGPGFKVIGGYDVINNDTDPMDDHSHGTHVAGIVAADGDEIKGIAPKALLMAFKVLDAGGSGTEAAVIEGIERAVDPNNDGDSSDKVDIANMSLGGEGNPDDALSTAVDNAVELGVVFCIAAGNEGEYGFSTIGSPGTARRAITVGASDKSDQMAYFSSKGPNPKIYSIKPEVVAPGVDINSTVLNEGYEYHSGTSMAAPHVTGVCALLKSIHPDWIPDQIKSALMTTAVDIDEEVMVQGSGRIDALGAAKINTTAKPAHLSFGLDDISQSIWNIDQTVVISNHSNSVREYNISIDPLMAGISLTATPSVFSLSPDDSQNIVFSLIVDNDVVPSPEESLALDGHVYINGTEDTLHLPWTFVICQRIIITFNLPYPMFILQNDKYYSDDVTANWIDLYTAELLVPKGVYDLCALMWDEDKDIIIIKEEFLIEGVMNLSINSSEATNQIIRGAIDEQGQLLSSSSDSFFRIDILFPDSSMGIGWGGTGIYPVFFSDFSSRYKVSTGEMNFYNNNGYIVNHPLIAGLESDITLINDINDYKTVDIVSPNLSSNPSTIDIHYLYEIEGVIGFLIAVNGYDLNSDEWKGKMYLTQDVIDGIFMSIGLRTSWVDIPYFMVFKDSIGCSWWYTPFNEDYLVPSGGEMIFSGIPFYPGSVFWNNYFGTYNISINQYFSGPLREHRNSDFCHTTYVIYDSLDKKVASGRYDTWQNYNVAPGRYRVETTNSNHFFKGMRGKAFQNVWFDLRLEDPQPPRLFSLQVRNSEGVPTYQLEQNESATLRFSATDNVYLWNIYQPIISDSTRLYYKKFSTDSWQPLEFEVLLEDTSYIGTLYSADLSQLTATDSSAYGIKIYIEDQSGNSAEWTLDPAFTVGDFVYYAPSDFSLLEPVYEEILSEADTVQFIWNASTDEDSDTLTYKLNIFNAKIDTTIENIYDTSFVFHNKDFLPENLYIQWAVSASDGITTTASSDIFRFSIGEVSDINELAQLPKEFALYQNYPNPFNPSTTISFALPTSELVKISIYDILGREVKTLINKTMQAGIKKVEWDGRNNRGNPVPSGMYFYKLEAGRFNDVKKMLIIK